MKNIFKYILPIIIIFFISSVLGDTAGFNAIGNSSWRWGSYYYISTALAWLLNWENAQNILFNIFYLLAGFLFIVALIVAFFAAIRLFSSSNSEEDFSKWLNTLAWSILGLLLVALSAVFINTLRRIFWSGHGLEEINISTVYSLAVDIIYPILNFLRYIAAICFFIVLIYAFYRIIFSGWDEERFQAWKKIFIMATLGFIIMLLAEPIVKMAYWWDDCLISTEIWSPTPNHCMNREFDTSVFLTTAIKVIIFLNGFVALVTVVMIIYAGFLLLTGGWDEEKSEKSKKIITYIIIGVLIILFSYAIYRALLFNVAPPS